MAAAVVAAVQAVDGKAPETFWFRNITQQIFTYQKLSFNSTVHVCDATGDHMKYCGAVQKNSYNKPFSASKVLYHSLPL